MARRRAGSPLGNIIRWFLGAGLAEAEQALETAQTIVEQKREVEVAKPKVLAARVPPPETVTGTTTPRAARKPRAKRSDAGKPRQSTAAAMATPPSLAEVPPIAPGRVTRRRQPVMPAAAVPAVPVAAAVPAVAVAAEPLPDSFVGEEE